MVSHGVPHAWNLARSAHGKSNTVSKGSVRRAGFVQVWVVCIAVVYQGRWQRSFSSAVHLPSQRKATANQQKSVFVFLPVTARRHR